MFMYFFLGGGRVVTSQICLLVKNILAKSQKQKLVAELEVKEYYFFSRIKRKTILVRNMQRLFYNSNCVESSLITEHGEKHEHVK